MHLHPVARGRRQVGEQGLDQGVERCRRHGDPVHRRQQGRCGERVVDRVDHLQQNLLRAQQRAGRWGEPLAVCCMGAPGGRRSGRRGRLRQQRLQHRECLVQRLAHLVGEQTQQLVAFAQAAVPLGQDLAQLLRAALRLLALADLGLERFARVGALFAEATHLFARLFG